MQSFLVLRWAVRIVTTVLWMYGNHPRVKAANATVRHLECRCKIHKILYLIWNVTINTHQTGPFHMGASSWLIIWHPFKPIFFQRFRPRAGPEKILRSRAQIAYNFRRKSWACGNVSSLAPYFLLFRWHLSVPYRLASRAAARLVRPLIRPWYCPHPPKKKAANTTTVTSRYEYGQTPDASHIKYTGTLGKD